jgi:3-oxoacyl-(acyl-carrier-protein) synthase
MALFAQYALAAASEAMEDAGLQNLSDEERENVVCHPHPFVWNSKSHIINRASTLGLEDVVTTTLEYDKGVRIQPNLPALARSNISRATAKSPPYSCPGSSSTSPPATSP